MAVRGGQVFVMSAIIFSSLVLVAIISTQQVSTTTTNAQVETYFESVQNRQPEIVEAGLKQNYSIESVKKELYSFNRFVERRSTSKSLEYSSMQLAIIPNREKVVFLNYRGSMTSFSFHGDEWNNESVNPYQSTSFNISGSDNYRLMIQEADIDRSFNASLPRIFSSVRMETGETVLTDSLLR